MASSRVMASSSSAASDITRQSSIYSLKSLGSMNIDELFRNFESDGGGGDTSPATISRQGSVGNVKVDDAWREIDGGEMTLEDFLARAGAVREEDIRVSSGVFGSGRVGAVDPTRGGGRGRKRDTTMYPAERAVMQRKKRMIKYRESAARSIERKPLAQREREREREIPITEQRKEQRKPLRALRRTRSMEWQGHFSRPMTSQFWGIPLEKGEEKLQG